MIFNLVNKSSIVSPIGTAIERDVLEGKTYYSDGLKMVGTMPKINKEYLIENASDKLPIPEGYHDGTEVAKISEESLTGLVSDNIKQGVNILGVSGSYTAEYGSINVGDILLPIKVSSGSEEGSYNGKEFEGSFWLEPGQAYFIDYRLSKVIGRTGYVGVLRAYDLGDGMVGLFSYKNEYTYPLLDPNDPQYGNFFLIQGGIMDEKGVLTPKEGVSSLYIKRDILGTSITIGNIKLVDFGAKLQSKNIELDGGTKVVSYDKFFKQSTEPISPGEYITSLLIDTTVTPPRKLFDDNVDLFYWREDNGDFYFYNCSYNEMSEGKGFYFIGCTEVKFDAIYVGSDTMSLEEIQGVFTEMGLSLERLGWQKDKIAINAKIDGVNAQDIWGGFISKTGKYNYEKYDGLESVTVTSPGVELQERDVEIFDNNPKDITPDPGFAGFSKVRILPSIVSPSGSVHIKVLSLKAKDENNVYGRAYIVYFDEGSNSYIGTWVENGNFIEMDIPIYSLIFVAGLFCWKGPDLFGDLDYMIRDMVYNGVEYCVNALQGTQDIWICLPPADYISEEPPEEYIPYRC